MVSVERGPSKISWEAANGFSSKEAQAPKEEPDPGLEMSTVFYSSVNLRTITRAALNASNNFEGLSVSLV